MRYNEAHWQWARDFIQKQIDDERPGVSHLTNRPIMSIKQMLDSSVQMYAENTAFYTKFKKGPYQQITYRQFADDINGLGTALLNHGIEDKRIAVIGETAYMWCVGYMAAICGLGTIVPLDKELPYADLKNLINEAKVSVVIADSKREKSFLKMLEEKDTCLKVLISSDREESEDNIISERTLIKEGKELIKKGDRSYIEKEIRPDEMGIIIFTSGTTGMAKGIMLSQRNICANVMAAPALIDFSAEDVFFSVLPIHHTFECTCDFIIPLYKGGAIAHCEGLRYIVKNMQEVKPTIIMGVPAIFEALHKSLWKGIEKKNKTKEVERALKISKLTRKVKLDVSSILFKDIKETFGGRLRLMICGGAAANPKILDDLNNFGILAVQGYGLSECAPLGALNPENKHKSSSVGIPLPGVEAMIYDAENGTGEICLRGDNVMLGYYNNQEATDEVLKDGWFHTGDLGYIDEEGYIFITGRKKNVIITKNGKNVFPEEIEMQLTSSGDIAEAMVFQDKAEEKDDTVIVAAIYPDWGKMKEILGNDITDEKVTEYLWDIVDKINDENPGYKMIRRVVLRHSEFEKNSSKKIKRFVEGNKLAD